MEALDMIVLQIYSDMSSQLQPIHLFLDRDLRRIKLPAYGIQNCMNLSTFGILNTLQILDSCISTPKLIESIQ